MLQYGDDCSNDIIRYPLEISSSCPSILFIFLTVYGLKCVVHFINNFKSPKVNKIFININSRLIFLLLIRNVYLIHDCLCFIFNNNRCCSFWTENNNVFNYVKLSRDWLSIMLLFLVLFAIGCISPGSDPSPSRRS